MVDELISLETARLAKEKGFDVITTYFYDKLGERDICGYENWNKGYGKACSCCTQSLLQKWLREKHNCIVEVIFNFDPILTNGKIIWSVSVDNYKSDMTNVGIQADFESEELFKTYEEALEVGLQEALKII
jgi:hypothetical protein